MWNRFRSNHPLWHTRSFLKTLLKLWRIQRLSTDICLNYDESPDDPQPKCLIWSAGERAFEPVPGGPIQKMAPSRVPPVFLVSYASFIIICFDASSWMWWAMSLFLSSSSCFLVSSSSTHICSCPPFFFYFLFIYYFHFSSWHAHAPVVSLPSISI